MAKFTFHSDCGHGWLAVKRKLLIELDLIGKISNHSYQKGSTVYLEEDCDASLFVQTYEGRLGEKPVIVHGKHYDNANPIRGYASFVSI